MDTPIRFLEMDYKVQKILLILSLVAILTFYLFFIPFLLLGFWQLISGFYGAIKLKSKHHFLYLGLAIPYLIFIILFIAKIMGTFSIGELLFFCIFVPFIMAILFFHLTKKTKEGLEENIEIEEFEMKDILDS